MRGTVATFGLFAAIILLIHSQPMNDGGMHELLFTAGCPAPCFLGIQPGVTTVEAAATQLETGGLVGEWLEQPQETRPTNEVGMGLLRWRWSNLRPTSLIATQGSLAYDLRTRQITTFGRLESNVPLWVFIVALGEPSVSFMSGGYNDRNRPVFRHVASYPQWHVNLVSYVSCPMSLRQLWESPVSVELSNTVSENARFSDYPVRVEWVMRRTAAYFC